MWEKSEDWQICSHSALVRNVIQSSQCYNYNTTHRHRCFVTVLWLGLVLPLWVWAAATAVFARLCFWRDAAGSCYSSAPLTLICRHPVELGGGGAMQTRVQCVAKLWLMPSLLNKYPECLEQIRVSLGVAVSELIIISQCLAWLSCGLGIRGGQREFHRFFLFVCFCNFDVYVFISHLFQQERDKLLHQSLVLWVTGIQVAEESHCTCTGHLIVPIVTGKGE